MEAESLIEFLENRLVVGEGAYYTHVSSFGAKYSMRGKGDYDVFWDLYCTALRDTGHEKFKLGLAEKPLSEVPLVVDIDIKIPGAALCKDIDPKGVPHLYTRKQILSCVDIFQTVIKNTVKDVDDAALSCVLLEKPVQIINDNDKTYTKNGLHLHFPYIFLKIEDIKTHIYPRAKRLIGERNVFASIGVEDSAALLDEGVASAHWLMYGCRKKPGQPAYEATCVINSLGEEMGLECLRSYEIFDNKEQPVCIEEDVKYYLPRVLSILPYGRVSRELMSGLCNPLEKSGMSRNILQAKIKASEPPLEYSTPFEDMEDKAPTEEVVRNLKECEVLLDMLHSEMYDDYKNWMYIGFLLFCVGEGTKEGYYVWRDFSSKSEKFDEAACRKAWGSMRKGGLTIRTMHYLAKENNPEAYDEYLRETGKKRVNSALEGSHRDLAAMLYTQYRHSLACADVYPTGGQWFEFKSHRWTEAKNGVLIRNLLSDNIGKIFQDELQKCVQMMGTSTDKAVEAFYTTRSQQIRKIIRNLNTRHFKVSVEKEAADIFYDEEFKSKLNKDPYLFCFKNGVYDLNNNEFRDGRPEDFLTTYTDINYNANYSETHPAVMQVRDYLMKVFPDPELRTYFLDTTCDVFTGGNHQKLVLVWSGDGDNAKSVTQLLVERMLHKYAIKFNTQLITGKKTAIGGASPELARGGDGVRWAVLQEPNNDEEINVGTLKELSGNDSYWARDLYERGKETREIIPMFKLVLITNKLPKIKFSDQATWNRIRVLPFEATFVKPGSDNPAPDTLEEQMAQKRFPAEPNFDKKIPGMLEPLAWLLLEHRKTILCTNETGQKSIQIHEPKKVRIATEKYKMANDMFTLFTNENIVKEARASVSVSDVYETFKSWFRNGYPNQQIIQRSDLQEALTKSWKCEPENGLKWHGYRLKTIKDHENKEITESHSFSSASDMGSVVHGMSLEDDA